MNAPSIIGDAFFDLLKKELVSLDVRRNKIDLTPLITTYETTCVCTDQRQLKSKFSDFEHALQYYSAIENQCEYIITRNIEDYSCITGRIYQIISMKKRRFLTTAST